MAINIPQYSAGGGTKDILKRMALGLSDPKKNIKTAQQQAIDPILATQASARNTRLREGQKRGLGVSGAQGLEARREEEKAAEAAGRVGAQVASQERDKAFARNQALASLNLQKDNMLWNQMNATKQLEARKDMFFAEQNRLKDAFSRGEINRQQMLDKQLASSKENQAIALQARKEGAVINEMWNKARTKQQLENTLKVARYRAELSQAPWWQQVFGAVGQIASAGADVAKLTQGDV